MLPGSNCVTAAALIAGGWQGAQAEQTLSMGIAGEIQAPVRTGGYADRARQSLPVRLLEATHNIDHVDGFPL